MQNENLRLSGSDKSDVTKFEGKSPTPRCVSPFHQLTSLKEKNKLSRLSWSLIFFKQKGLMAYTSFFSWTDSGIWEHWRLKCSIINAASVRKEKFHRRFTSLKKVWAGSRPRPHKSFIVFEKRPAFYKYQQFRKHFIRGKTMRSSALAKSGCDQCITFPLSKKA